MICKECHYCKVLVYIGGAGLEWGSKAASFIFISIKTPVLLCPLLCVYFHILQQWNVLLRANSVSVEKKDILANRTREYKTNFAERGDFTSKAFFLQKEVARKVEAICIERTAWA